MKGMLGMKKNKFKSFLVFMWKGTLIMECLCFALIILFIAVTQTIRQFEPGLAEKVIEVGALYFTIIFITLGLIFIILTFCIGDERLYTPKKMAPDDFKLKDCKKLFKTYQKELESKGFKSYKYSYPTFNMSFWVKQEPDIDIVNLFIDVNELTEEIYKSYDKDGFQEFGLYILKNKIIVPDKHTKVYHFIKVAKSNVFFEEYINTPPVNEYFRSRVVVGIDGEKEKIYFPNKKDGMAAKLYMEDKKNLEESMKKYFE